MLISVTKEDIEAATPLPCTSPLCQSLKRMGKDAIANHVAIYIDGDRYELPESVKQSEKAFDYYVKAKELQGKHLEAIAPYEFEL